MSTKRTKLGLIMGSSRFNINELDTYNEHETKTRCGVVFTWLGRKSIVIPRHGEYSNIPPHNINHQANMLVFEKHGIKKIVSFTSVGSLKLDLEPTTIIIPDDYINMGTICTYFDDRIRHIIPGLDRHLRDEIHKKIKELPIKIKFNGIYIQTRGPRLETKAEIQMLKNFGDVVGMTMGAEATLAKELGISYANISIVDNYCNGVIDEPLSIHDIEKNQTKNGNNIEKIIKRLLN